MPRTAEIFSNIPKRDFLSLFHEDQTQYQNVVKYLNFRKEDISKATGVPLTSVRYDEKIPAELVDRMREWAILLNLVAEHFQGDKRKTVLWFSIPNPMLGNVSPRDMLRFGRYKKLLKFIVNSITENKR